MKIPSLLLLLGVAANTAACVHTGFTPTTGLALPARPPNCYLDQIFQGIPPYPYIVIGKISTDSTAGGLFAIGEDNNKAIKRMREQACQVGAHGLLNMDANSHGSWTSDGYSKSTTGGAVAFVYVDQAGRPLPPPNAPAVLIQRGAYAAPAPGAYPPAAYQPVPPAPAPAANPSPPAKPASTVQPASAGTTTNTGTAGSAASTAKTGSAGKSTAP